jgi:hypothetical protein
MTAPRPAPAPRRGRAGNAALPQAGAARPGAGAARLRIGSALARAAAACAAVLAAAAPAAHAAEPAAPRETEISYYWDIFDHSMVRPVTRLLDPALGIRKLTGNPREAANVDERDQVRLPSTWWQPRLGFREVSVAQMLSGPGPGTGPAPGPWSVTRAKTQGVTPGFFVQDSNGDRFILKFDPPAYPEMATGAEVVATHLYWAAGYNVPDNAIVFFRPESLRIADGATYSDPLGRKQPLPREFLDRILDRLPRRPDGTVRAVASRLIAGKPLGPFEYRGRRRDDPEDLIPHELRRELRGLWTLAAWTNHADVRGPNSLDVWVTEGGRSFVRHHLIDFGSCLGSGALAARSYVTGGEYFVDWGIAARSLVTLRLGPFPWEGVADPRIPSLGFIEADAFDPARWRPDYPNPAFDERTERDVRWGARIVGGFTDAHIRAAVERARYSDPRAAEELARVLMARRDKIVARWLDRPVAGTVR